MPRKSFWQDVLRAWCQYNYESIEHVEEVDIIANNIIWLNSDIVVNGKPMLNKKCLSRGII